MKIFSLSFLYWLVPLILMGMQIIFTLNSFNQLRYEEAANSVRNPYWLSQRSVYGGASSNVGWEGPLAIIYSIFGFSLFTGKYLRLILHLISLFALAALLKKYLGVKLALIPLITIGLSPTLLYFNILASPYAIDFEYLPIIFFLLIQKKELIRLIGCFLAMMAWMSYPPFMFYLPSLLFFHLRGENVLRNKALLGGVLAGLGAFLSPLILALIYVENRQSLLNDSVKGSGIFRGGGGMFPPVEGTIDLNLKNLFSDLFGKGVSYNFDLHLGEFSLIFPILAVLLVLIFGFILLKYPKMRVVVLVWAVFIFNFIIYTFISDLTGFPGVRRATGMLVAFYILFVLVWWKAGNWGIRQAWGIRIILGLLLLHHLIVYPINLSHLKDLSLLGDPTGFFEKAKTPQESLKVYLSKLQKEDVYLKCQMIHGEGELANVCRYAEMYAALKGSCLWNKLSCHDIFGYDWNINKYVLLNTKLWDENYFEP